MLRHVLVIMLLAPKALVWSASDETPWGTGLEVDNTTQLKVFIQEMSEAGNEIGLTSERIEARVNQSLRKAGITPVSAAAGTEEYLYVNVNALASGSYTITIFFDRRVFYRTNGKPFTSIGTTWRRRVTGIAHGGADYILDRIAENVEVFCNEFLKANGK